MYFIWSERKIERNSDREDEREIDREKERMKKRVRERESVKGEKKRDGRKFVALIFCITEIEAATRKKNPIAFIY